MLSKHDIGRMYRSGMTQREIADTLGVSHATVYCHMKQYGIKARPTKVRDRWGDKHPQWKGPDASLRALHRRVERRRGKPQRCEGCGTTDPSLTYDWANQTGQYDVVEDYQRLCRSCHRKNDDAVCNLRGQNKQDSVPF